MPANPLHGNAEMKEGAHRRLMGLGAALVALLLLLNAALALSNVRAVSRAEASAIRTQSLSSEIDGLLSAMKDTETGERGFLITGRDEYLEPYQAGLADVGKRLSTLSRLTESDGVETVDLREARGLVDAGLTLLAEAISRAHGDTDRQQGLEAARALVRTDRSKAMMDQLRDVVGRMREREALRFDAQQHEIAARQRSALTTTVASLIFDLLLLGVMVLVVRRQLREAEETREATEQRAAERKRAADALRESEERLRLFIEHAPASLAMFDKDMRYLSASRRWSLDYGLGERDLHGLCHYEVFGEISEEWKTVHRRALAGEVVRSESDCFVRADGSRQWLRWEVRPWRDAEGIIGGIVIFTEDITTLTRIVEEAREAAQWLELAQSAAGAGAWQWSLGASENVWSDELWKLYGLEKGSRAPSFDTWLEVVVPEDRAEAARLAKEAAAHGGDLSIEFRVKWPDGTVHHLLSRAQPMHDGGGRPEKYLGIVLDITERKQAEDMARRTEQEKAAREVEKRVEERYRALLEAAPDAMVVVDEHCKIVLVNIQTETIFGYPRDELVGRDLDVLIPGRFQLAHHGHVTNFFSNPTPRSMHSGLALFGVARDGREIPIEVSLGVLKTDLGVMVSAAIRDVSERKRIEAQAKLASDRLMSAVESVPNAFALFDDEERLVLCNGAFRDLVGALPAGSPIGGTYAELLSRWMRRLDFADEAAKARFREEQLARRGIDPRDTFEVRTLDGRSLRVVDHRTAEGGMVTIVWDLTENERRSRELQEAREAAEAGSAAKTDFLSSMSHELRTPLNAVLGFAQLLQRDRKEPLSERHRDRVEQIVKGGEHLLRLVDDVLDLSRIEARQVSLSLESVHAGEVVEEVKATLEPMASRHGVQLRVGALPEELPTVVADRTRFAQMLINLGSNAIKYNEQGGTVTFTVSRPSTRFLRITVQDDGMGIADPQQRTLFQPFQRAGQEAGPIEGTGIGLVITQRLAHLMQGDVGFHSVLGEGSEFWVDLPIHGVPVRRSGVTATVSTRVPPKADGRRRGILYVEDNPANVALLRDLIGAFDDVELLTAPTAEMGIELARERHPDLIVMDLNLPGSVSGIDALRVLRGSPATSAIPVIALTAAASKKDQLLGLQAGFARYLAKPVHLDELEEALQTLLAKAG